MQTLTLQEYERCPVNIPLDLNQRRTLTEAKIYVEPPEDDEHTWVLHPSSRVGGLKLADLAIVVRPKIPIDRVMFLMAYTIDPWNWRQYAFDLDPALDVLDAVAPAFVHHTHEAIRRGLLQGYLREEAALHTVRGRIRFGDQIKGRFGIPLPLEVAFDEFTQDIRENQLLKTALHRLSNLPIQSSQVRRGVGALRPVFNSVSLGAYRRGPAPDVEYSRLNIHYRPAVELARLIIENSSLELFHGEVTGASFMLDMTDVFQKFLTVALREGLGVSGDAFGERSIPSLDEDGRMHLKPDLVWRDGSSCVFVGDAKYKNISGKAVPESDIYQMLAYITALNLPRGMLIYAKDEGTPRVYQVRHSGKAVEVASLDLRGRPEDILADVGSLAKRVRAYAY